MPRYVALLRGINVSGSKTIPMNTLAELFERSGLRNAKTILASGNVIFDSPTAPTATLASRIEDAIREKFGFDVFVHVRPVEEIASIVKSNPFNAFTASRDAHWYVTFLNRPGDSMPDGKVNGCTFVSVRKQMLFSVLDRRKAKSTEFMTFLDKCYGKDVTTRNWNTLLKIAAAGS